MRLLFLLLVIACATTAQAQRDSLSHFIGGSISLSAGTRGSSFIFGPTIRQEEFFASVRPVLGKQVRPRLILGVSPQYSYTDYGDLNFGTGGQARGLHTIGMFGFIRYLIGAHDKLGFFLHNQVGFVHNRSTFTSRPVTGPGVGPDVEDLFISNDVQIAIIPQVYYQFGRIRLIANFGSLNFTTFGATKLDGEDVSDRDNQVNLSLRPSSFSIGGEYLY